MDCDSYNLVFLGGVDHFARGATGGHIAHGNREVEYLDFTGPGGCHVFNDNDFGSAAPCSGIRMVLGVTTLLAKLRRQVREKEKFRVRLFFDRDASISARRQLAHAEQDHVGAAGVLPLTLEDVAAFGCLHLYSKGGNTAKALFARFSQLLKPEEDPSPSDGSGPAALRQHYAALGGSSWSDLDFQVTINKRLCPALRSAEVYAAVERGVTAAAGIVMADMVVGYEEWKRHAGAPAAAVASPTAEVSSTVPTFYQVLSDIESFLAKEGDGLGEKVRQVIKQYITVKNVEDSDRLPLGQSSLSEVQALEQEYYAQPESRGTRTAMAPSDRRDRLNIIASHFEKLTAFLLYLSGDSSFPTSCEVSEEDAVPLYSRKDEEPSGPAPATANSCARSSADFLSPSPSKNRNWHAQESEKQNMVTTPPPHNQADHDLLFALTVLPQTGSHTTVRVEDQFLETNLKRLHRIPGSKRARRVAGHAVLREPGTHPWSTSSSFAVQGFEEYDGEGVDLGEGAGPDPASIEGRDLATTRVRQMRSSK